MQVMKMGEQKMIRKNMMKNIVINFIMFLIMFLIFDGIIYHQISQSLYFAIDEELYRSKQKYIQRETNMDSSADLRKQSSPKEIGGDRNINPRVISIVRNENGDVLNSENIGRVYSEFENEITFNKENLDTLYSLELSGVYSYRAINFKASQSNGQEVYVQLLANVDGERQTLGNLTAVLLWGTIILSAIALFASYMLAKRVMKPIMKNYKKQTEFVQNASHELRTPIAIIKAQQELLLREPNSKIIEKSENINQTLKETKRMTKLMKELMDLARADSNQVKIDKTDFSINELIQEIIVPYEEYAKLQQKEIRLELKDTKTIKADKNKISELLIILLDNAIKYTNAKDEIIIKTERKDGKINLEVADTGIGISDEAMPHVFERFYRGDESHSKKIEGSGLGLSIAQSIVDMHNGTIKVMHNEPKGTRVIVRFI